MATIKLCDWTKQRLPKDEQVYVVSVGEVEFEVGEEGKRLLLEQLEGNAELGTPKVEVVERVVEREAPPPGLQPAAPGGVQIEVKDDPFSPGPTSMPEPPQAAQPPQAVPADMDPEMLLDIPDDPKQRLRVPPAKLAQRIIEEATKFEEGTLPALTMGAQQQREAMKKLKALEGKQEEAMRRRAPKGVNINADVRDKSGYYE